MRYCQTCGAAFADGATFCPNCSSNAQTVAPPMAASGLQPNAAGALTYLAGLITGIIFLVIDPYKSDRFVRFHAFQSILFNIAWIALWIVWTMVGMVLGAVTKGLFFILQIPIDLLLMVAGLGLWIYLMYSAYQHKMTKLPIIGQIAARQAGV
jgi:uncharacterized membrane protein